jgi:hypothetical protein
MCSACFLHILQSFGCICNVLQNELMYSKCTHWAHVLKYIGNINRQINLELLLNVPGGPIQNTCYDYIPNVLCMCLAVTLQEI